MSDQLRRNSRLILTEPTTARQRVWRLARAVGIALPLALTVVACAPGDAGEAAIEGGSAPPDLTLIVDGEKFTATQVSSCWGGLCADAGPPPVIETFVELPADGQITLEFDGPKPDSVFIALQRYDTLPDAESAATTRLERVPNTITWTPGVPVGDYLLSIFAQWGQGNDVSYDIGVTIP